MNNKTVLTREEFVSKFNVLETSLREWEKEKLIKPAGYADDKAPLYAEDTGQRIKYIQRLNELGYGADEIRTIIKKVGLPRVVEKRDGPVPSIKFLTVGNLAERVGLSARTIKHWEDKGIIEPDMRSEGGFRLYSGVYVYLCELIRDLQLFGYTLEEIKVLSDYFRDFLTFQNDLEKFPRNDVSQKLEVMLKEIEILFDKMDLLEKGIGRWEDLLKKKKKEILSLKNRNQKRKD